MSEMSKCISVLADALDALGNDEADKKKVQAALRALLTDSSVSPPSAPAPVATAIKRKSRVNVASVKFRGQLRKVVMKSPERCADLVEPLRQRGVLLSKDDAEAAVQVKTGFMKSPRQYREYPNDRWGLLAYTAPQLVMSG